MRVLWFSVTPSLFDEKKYGGWIASLEQIVRSNNSQVELAIAFEYDSPEFKVNKGGTTYYPINVSNSIKDRLIEKVDFDYRWNRLKPKMLSIINDFKPDIIQCFGTEWPYGLISQYTNIPVVIHMQGFTNIYNESCSLVYSDWEYIRCHSFNPKVAFTTLTNRKKIQNHLKREEHLMQLNRYYMGRTDWDRNIVNYYSLSGQYFYCPEALRPGIYQSEPWHLIDSTTYKLVTITQAGILKGNEIILRTAKILKDQFNFSFEWNVAGNPNAFKVAEKKTGICHSDYNINLLGMIDSEQVAQELSSSRVYIHPAIIDNSPNSLCEAQIVGCPVIAANVGGISSLVSHNQTGILYPYNEPHTLAFNIMELCQDDEKLQQLSKTERKLALQRHDPDAIFKNLINIYNKIITSKGENHDCNS